MNIDNLFIPKWVESLYRTWFKTGSLLAVCSIDWKHTIAEPIELYSISLLYSKKLSYRIGTRELILNSIRNEKKVTESIVFADCTEMLSAAQTKYALSVQQMNLSLMHDQLFPINYGILIFRMAIGV